MLSKLITTAAAVCMVAGFATAVVAAETATSPNGKPSGATGTGMTKSRMAPTKSGMKTMDSDMNAMPNAAGRTNTHGTPHGTTGGTHSSGN